MSFIFLGTIVIPRGNKKLSLFNVLGGQTKYYGRHANGGRTIERFALAEWSRAIVEESKDHRNDRMMAQFSKKLLRKGSSINNNNMACTVIDRRNDFKMLKTLHENMNIEHFDAISMVDDSIEREKLLSIC